MKKITMITLALVFAIGSVGFAYAQTTDRDSAIIQIKQAMIAEVEGEARPEALSLLGRVLDMFDGTAEGEAQAEEMEGASARAEFCWQARQCMMQTGIDPDLCNDPETGSSFNGTCNYLGNGEAWTCFDVRRCSGS